MKKDKFNSNGYIFLFRKIFQWEWYTDGNTFRVFIHCLLKANFQDKKWKDILIERGKLYTSIPNLSEELNLTEQNIKTALKHLKKTNEIKVDRKGNGILITIYKYNDYQLNINNDCHKVVKKNVKKQKTIKLNEDGAKFFNEIKEVVDYLNLKTNRSGNRKFKPESISSKHIRGRLKEGYKVEDLKNVIDLKVKEWLGNKTMNKYLRINTLFNSEKFEIYIDEYLDSNISKSVELMEGLPITLENISLFDDKDWFEVFYTDLRNDEGDREEHLATVQVKQIRNGINKKIGKYRFKNVIN